MKIVAEDACNIGTKSKKQGPVLGKITRMKQENPQLKARRPYIHAKTRTFPQYPVKSKGKTSNATTGTTLGNKR